MALVSTLMRVGCVCAALGLFSGYARALVVAPPPSLPLRVDLTPTIIVARVVEMEGKDIDAFPFKGAAKKIPHRIAVVKVVEALKGTKKDETIRIGFPAPPEKKGSSIKPVPRFGISLEVGQEGLFFLRAHFVEPFHVIPMYYDETSSKRPNYRKELELTRFAVRFADDPVAALQAKDARDRYYGAALLLFRYRSPVGASLKTEPIDDKVSRSILGILQEADWEKDELVPPWAVFSLLGLTKADGWNMPAKATADENYRAARAWLRDHVESYRILRFVGDEKRDRPK